MKKIYFVDTENVSVYSFLKEENCSNKDKLILLTTANSTSIKLEYLKLIQETGIEVIFEEVSTGAKNELDFYLITKMVLEMNKLNSENYEFIIVSNDKGFRTAIDCIKRTMPDINARIYAPMKSKKKKKSKENKKELLLNKDDMVDEKESELNKTNLVNEEEVKSIDKVHIEQLKKEYNKLTDEYKMKSLLNDISNSTLQQKTYDLIKQAVENDMNKKSFESKLKTIFNEESHNDIYEIIIYKSNILVKNVLAKKHAKESIELTLNNMDNKDIQVETYALIKNCISNNSGHRKFKRELHVILDKLDASVSLKNKIFGALSTPVKEILTK